MKEGELSLPRVRRYLQKIAESVKKLSQGELRVSGVKNRFYMLASLSLDEEAFFVNLAFITTERKMQLQIEHELMEWLSKHQLFSEHEWDFVRKQL